jgi:outer membrane protein TolC
MSNIKKSSIFHRSGVWQRIAGNVCAIALLLAVIVSETAGQVDEAGTRPMISLADAVRSTALRHPGVQIAKEAINLSQAANLEASSAFDDVVSNQLSHQRLQTPLTTEQQSTLQLPQGSSSVTSTTSNLLNWSLGSTRLFRNGMSMGPTLSVGRVIDNVYNQSGNSTAVSRFQFTVPLLRGRGRQVVAAEERATGIEITASRRELDDTLARLIAATVSSYWTTVAALANYKIMVDAEQRGMALVATTKALIAGDQLPKVELNNAMANLASRRASRLLAEVTLSQMRQQLALNAGLPSRELALAPDPSDSFPDYANAQPPEVGPDRISLWVALAVGQRPDLLAATKHLDADRVRISSARDHLRPQLDLTVATGYSGATQGRSVMQYLQAPFSLIPGPDAIVGITYQFSRANNHAKSEVLKSEATVREDQAREDEIRRSIESDIAFNLNNIRISLFRLRSADDAVDSSAKALEGEKQRFLLGASSMVELLQVEDLLTSALLNRVQAQLDYAVSIAQFRLVDGEISASSGDDVQLFFRGPDSN